jgi:hypothetical protein
MGDEHRLLELSDLGQPHPTASVPDRRVFLIPAIRRGRRLRLRSRLGRRLVGVSSARDDAEGEGYPGGKNRPSPVSNPG